ncbi:peptidylprolyl isomerase [Lacihabitans sp. LS3-19]|uniref:FKBP-type peptidyl-prolyl cis-trans isomerase n=1 Tax=Lacihabitans sp. LS3-19 TaxID=2487335 RepID=UPI0020CE75D0|nr:FKBP-type peptidyl-prolyl cis-trans isomerase [Lacihabitans sp. LS3-19]MCP9767828.1 peptidylprolyl isomerase [Lacihabitans sp. LS3-19]
MKFTFSVLTILTVLGLVSCDKFKVTTTENGDRLLIHEKGKSGKLGKDGDIISFDLVIKTAADSTIKDSYKEGQSFTVPIQKGAFKGSFENALYHIGEGDSTTVLVNADSLFKLMNQPLAPGITKGSDLKFIVKMHKVQTRADFEKELADKKANEPKIIEEFVAKSMKNAQKTTEGIYYVENNVGTGATPVNGEVVVVEYVGKFMDGKIFDQSNGQPFEVPLGESRVIPGWEVALKTMKKGGKSTFIIPSPLAYGEQGGGPIAPNTPLVFDITLNDIKKK